MVVDSGGRFRYEREKTARSKRHLRGTIAYFRRWGVSVCIINGVLSRLLICFALFFRYVQSRVSRRFVSICIYKSVSQLDGELSTTVSFHFLQSLMSSHLISFLHSASLPVKEPDIPFSSFSLPLYNTHRANKHE